MSEFDEVDFDDSDLAELAAEDPDNLTPEDVFKMVMVNKVRKKRVRVELQDKDGDKVELSEVIVDLMKYMKDKLTDENGNQFNEQIMPLISQSVVSCLGRLIGIPATAFHLSQDSTRTAIIWSMCMAFLLLKYVQKHNLVINTVEEDLSDEDIEEIERKGEANRLAMMGAMMGQDPKAVLNQLLEEGRITKKDLQEMLGGSGSEENEDDNDDDNGSSKD